MPHSQDHDVDYPPINELEEYRQELRNSRLQWDEGERAKYLVQPLLEIGEILLGYCDFFIQKRTIKVRVHCWISTSASLPEILYNGKTANEADLLSM
jgi:hypothetical protein